VHYEHPGSLWLPNYSIFAILPNFLHCFLISKYLYIKFQGNQFVEVISAMGLVFYCLQIVLNFLVVKKIDGVSITKI